MWFPCLCPPIGLLHLEQQWQLCDRMSTCPSVWSSPLHARQQSKLQTGFWWSVCAGVCWWVWFEWLLNRLIPFLYPGNLLEYAGMCVTSCPVGYTPNGAKCVACSGVCPRGKHTCVAVRLNTVPSLQCVLVLMPMVWWWVVTSHSSPAALYWMVHLPSVIPLLPSGH